MTDRNSNSDLLNLPYAYATRVFANDDGGVTIIQNDPMGGDVSIVALTKDQAEQVYLALQAFVEAD